MRERCKNIIHKALAVVRPQFRLHFTGGIHGLPHWSRVWFHGRALAAAADVDPAVLAWFAYELEQLSPACVTAMTPNHFA